MSRASTRNWLARAGLLSVLLVPIAGLPALAVPPQSRATALEPGARPGEQEARGSTPAVFDVGTATVDIDPGYPVYLGGYGGGQPGGTLARHVDPLTGRPENLTVRAISIGECGHDPGCTRVRHVVELASVDTQGYFAGYEEGPYGISDIRRAAAAFLRSRGVGASEADIIVSALHEHAAPTLLGIWGPPQHNEAYLRAVARATTRALEEAYLRSRPATITWGSIEVPWVDDLTIAEGNAFPGWPRDGSLVALWARSLATGATIATYVSEPAYPNIVDGAEDLLEPDGKPAPATLISGDFPGYAEAWIESRLGGTAILASGSLGNQTGPMQHDTAPSPDLPSVRLDGHTYLQTRAFDDELHMGILLGELALRALARHGSILTDPTVAGAEQRVVSPIENAPLAVLNYGDAVDQAAGTSAPTEPVSSATGVYPIDRAASPPYSYGAALGTWVTGLRIGGLLFLSLPGEFFGSIHQTWQDTIKAAQGVFVVGAAQDFLGYEYPAYAYPFTYLDTDEAIFGPSLSLGDQVTTAGELDAEALGFRGDPAATPETTVADNPYADMAKPGVQLLAFPDSGDLDPATGTFTPVLEGYSGPPATTTAQCTPPDPVPAPPACPEPLASMGPFRWSFGDGSSASTPVQAEAASNLSPFLLHPYWRPGTYTVAVEAEDTVTGQVATYSLPVFVHPALRAAILRQRSRYEARATGGDGHLLLERWELPDGAVVYGPEVPASAVGRGILRLCVLDGTGAQACASLRVP